MSGVHSHRAVGYLRPPTAEQVIQYAASQHLPIASEEVETYRAGIAVFLDQLDQLDELAEPKLPVRYRKRDPGSMPNAAEDPYNAIIRFCEVIGSDAGPLAGMRVGVKDCIAVAGVPMTVGGRRSPMAVPVEDAVVVERLLDAGAVIVAKTNMADMAVGMGESSAFGAARNPRNPRYSTGGSSSGSAAAVAAGMVDGALGSDQAGSIRVPAAWCGIVGMKATHGLVPSHGLVCMDHTIDHIGPMTKEVGDNAAMLEVMAGGDWRDPQGVGTEPVSESYRSAADIGIDGLRIGVLTDSLEPAGCTPETLRAFEWARNILTKLGADVAPVSVPLWNAAGVIAAGLVCFSVAATFDSPGQVYGYQGRVDTNLLATAAAQYRLGVRDFPFAMRTLLLVAEHLRESYQGVHFGHAQNLRLELRRQVDAVLGQVDLLVTPTTPIGPFELTCDRLAIDELDQIVGMEMGTNPVVNTFPLDLTGHPALTIPAGLGENDLPMGLQIIGRRFDEHTIYRAAFAFEAAT